MEMNEFHFVTFPESLPQLAHVDLPFLCTLSFQDRSRALKVDKRTGPRKSFKKRCNPDVEATKVRYPPPFPNGW